MSKRHKLDGLSDGQISNLLDILGEDSDDLGEIPVMSDDEDNDISSQ
jgi:hypothetical protein